MAGGMHGRGHEWQGACMAGGMHGRGHAWQGACMAGGMNGGVRGTGVRDRGRGACMAGEMATAASSMHPTGMHSCFMIFFLWNGITVTFYLSCLNPKDTNITRKKEKKIHLVINSS